MSIMATVILFSARVNAFFAVCNIRKIAKAKKRAFSVEREPKQFLVDCAVRNSTE